MLNQETKSLQERHTQSHTYAPKFKDKITSQFSQKVLTKSGKNDKTNAHYFEVGFNM